MYHLVIENLGNDKCVDTNNQDIYTDNMQINCLSALNLPINITFVKNLNVRCVADGLGVTTSAKVYKS